MKKFKKKKLDDTTQKSSFIEEYFVKIKEENEKIEKMMSNIDYIKWLYQFTQEIDAFSSETLLYCPEKLSASDRKNADQLDLFYEGIKKYANQNYIYPTPCEFGNFYKIRLNEIGFC